MFSRLEILGDEDTDFDLLIAYHFVRRAVDAETIETVHGCGIVEGSHDQCCEMRSLGRRMLCFVSFPSRWVGPQLYYVEVKTLQCTAGSVAVVPVSCALL